MIHCLLSAYMLVIDTCNRGWSDRQDARTISEDASVEPPSDTDLTIAVIGHRNVGKSTMIKRATKAWGVSDVAITTTDQGFISTFRDYYGMSRLS